ncbi:MAG: 2-amino-4-hydroxy-6-hydroxymethyldihydropteridine diphosphokinase [Lachnospiraceae bacterium]|nr:2-amino-4-hydroxy-6-hydroxymethyldihydropteridine diphosphokinase [Lachnospiraceae bacterium]
MDKITIKKLEIYANHGVLKEERELGQKFLVTAQMYLDTRKAGSNDTLEDTIDYGKICFRIQRFLTEHTYKLIETAAEELAKELLYTVPRLRALDIEIEKPWAPIGLPLETVSITIHRGWHQSFIALGSNMGDRHAYMKHGVRALNQSKDFRVKSVSSFLETRPYGMKKQDNFLNGCMLVETLLTPEELLEFLQGVEHSVNRVREGKWGPRTLDLDIIFYDNLIMDTANLKIPHMDMHNRDFVLFPLCQIAPNYSHPVLHKTVSMLAEELQGEGTIIKKETVQE